MLDIFTLQRKVIRWFDEPKAVTPADLDGMTIHELFEVCNSDAAHVATPAEVELWDKIPDAWQVDAQADHADWLDEKRTREMGYPR